MEKPDNSARNIIIIGITMILLQGANLVGVAINRADIRHDQEDLIHITDKTNKVAADYVPMWFFEGMQQNDKYMIKELVARLGGDVKVAEETSEKYEVFKKTMMDSFINARGGVTMVTRGAKIDSGKQ